MIEGSIEGRAEGSAAGPALRLRARRTAWCLALAMLAGCATHAPPVAEPAPVAEPEAAPAPSSDDAVTPASDLDQALAAAQVRLRPDAPLVYTVHKGDTLWGIANRFLEDPWQWPELWYENSRIKNPHLIYPGERLSLVLVNGRTRLSGSLPDERLTPHVREVALDEEIPTVPIDAIRTFLNSPRIVTAEELATAPYILEFTDEHVSGGANDGLFVQHLPDNPASTWAVVEPGDPYRDPDTHELLGYEAIPIGNAHLLKLGQPATMTLATSQREARIGDRLLPIEEDHYEAYFHPHAPKKPVDGKIISVFDGVAVIPQYQVVALNRGTRDGLDPGTVLSILQAGKVVNDPVRGGLVKLPDQDAGTLLVFKTTSRVSYALVMKETRPTHVLDKVSGPQSGG